MAQRVDSVPEVSARFKKLWAHHPYNLTPKVETPCDKATYTNQCAIRLGVALVSSGYPLVGFTGALCWKGHGRKHPIRAEELGIWLNSDHAAFVGYADVIRATKRAAVAPQRFAGRTGIVLCRNFWGPRNQGDHIDLWDGAKMAGGAANFILASQEVWFWDV